MSMVFFAQLVGLVLSGVLAQRVRRARRVPPVRRARVGPDRRGQAAARHRAARRRACRIGRFDRVRVRRRRPASCGATAARVPLQRAAVAAARAAARAAGRGRLARRDPRWRCGATTSTSTSSAASTSASRSCDPRCATTPRRRGSSRRVPTRGYRFIAAGRADADRGRQPRTARSTRTLRRSGRGITRNARIAGPASRRHWLRSPRARAGVAIVAAAAASACRPARPRSSSCRSTTRPASRGSGSRWPRASRTPPLRVWPPERLAACASSATPRG